MIEIEGSDKLDIYRNVYIGYCFPLIYDRYDRSVSFFSDLIPSLKKCLNNSNLMT